MVESLGAFAGGLARSMESFNAVPTADQRQMTTWLFDDARRAIAAINGTTGGRIAIP